MSGSYKAKKGPLPALKILDVLFHNFAVGYTIKDLEKALAMNTRDVNEYLLSLLESGYAEQIPQTDRYRPSVGLAQKAMSVSRSLQSQSLHITELEQRINTEIN